MLSQLRPYQLIIVAFSAAILAALINNYLLYAVLLILSILMFSNLSRRFYFGLFLVMLLNITSDLGVNVRIFIQILSIGMLFLFFFKEYGLNFKEYKALPKPITNYLLYFFGVMLLTTFISEYPSAGLTLVLRTAIFFIISYIIYSFIRDADDEKMLFIVLIISGVILTFSVIAQQIISGNNPFDLLALSSKRLGGLVGNVNAVGGLLANLIPLIICFLFYSKIKKSQKNVLVILLLFISLGLIMVSSRSAYVSLFISIIIIIYTLKKSLFKWLFVLMGLFITIYLFYEPINEALSLMLRIQDGLSNRETFWALSTNIVNENIWFGIGPGSYQYELYNYMPVLLDSWAGNEVIQLMGITSGSNASHNFYLLFLSDMGIFGLIAALLIPVVFYTICIPVLKYYKSKSEFNYLVTLAIIAMGTGLFIRSFFDGVGLLVYGYITNDLPFWILFSVVIHHYKNIFMKGDH